MTKVCNRNYCMYRGHPQPVANFIVNDRTGYVRPECVACYNAERRRKHALKTEDKKLNKTLKTRYKINIEQFREMSQIQNNSCAICGIHIEQLKKRLFVDHNHETRKSERIVVYQLQ